MMRITLIALFVFTCLFTRAGKIDSLLVKISVSKNDSNKVILFNKVAREYLYKNPQLAFAYADSAELLSNKLKYDRGLSRAYTTKGIYYRNASEFDNSFKYHIDAIKICERTNDQKSLASNYTNLGVLFKTQGNFVKSLEYHEQSKKLFEELKDKAGIANCFQNISNTQRRLKNLDEAIKNAEEALKLFDELKDDGGRRSAYNAIANVYLEDKKDFNKALSYLLKMEVIVNKTTDLIGKSICYLNLGSCYNHLKKYKLAEEYTLKSLAISKELNNIENTGSSYQNLASIYEDKGDYKNALNYQKEFYRIADTLFGLKMKESTIEMEEKFHSEQSKKEIELLSSVNELKTKENEIQKDQLKKNQIAIILFILFAITITSLAVLFYKNYLKTKKLNNLLSNKNDQIEYQKKEILDSILYARRIQDSILSSNEELMSALPKHFIIYKPRDIVSGDFYWTYSLNLEATGRNISVVALCDCTGHGVPGAFMSLISYTILNQTVKDASVTGPDTVLNYLAKELPVALKSSGQSKDLRDGFDIALVGIDFENLLLECSMAHIPVYICNGKELKIIKPDKQSISANNYNPEFKFTLQKTKLNKGERIFLSTDGFSDQFGGEKGKKLKHKQLEKLLLESHHLPLNDQQKMLEDFFERWKGQLEQVDDVTLIGIEI